MKTQFFLSLLPLLLVAGCASEEPVVLYSEPKIPAFSSKPPAIAKSMSKDDEKKIQTAVYEYLLKHHPWEGSDYSALFLQADDDVVDAFIKKFPKLIPPIKPSSDVELRRNQPPLDKDTGKAAIILGADVGELNEDGSVDVTGRWDAGGSVRGTCSFLMKKSGDDWTISSVK
jgi:hypothetical protein